MNQSSHINFKSNYLRGLAKGESLHAMATTVKDVLLLIFLFIVCPLVILNLISSFQDNTNTEDVSEVIPDHKLNEFALSSRVMYSNPYNLSNVSIARLYPVSIVLNSFLNRYITTLSRSHHLLPRQCLDPYPPKERRRCLE